MEVSLTNVARCLVVSAVLVSVVHISILARAPARIAAEAK